MLAFLIPFIASCASTPIVRTNTVKVAVPVVQSVPEALTNPIPAPTLKGQTNGDLADYLLALQHALAEANARLRAIAGLKP